ncbi:unnamed protein product, partial [Rotaria magnacalcarata]
GEGLMSQQHELERMHSNAGLLPLHRTSSNEDYRYGKKINFYGFLISSILIIV